MTEMRTFISPKQCGCELRITAQWLGDAEIVDGRKVSYRHPVPFTIESIEIEKVCAEHEGFKTETPDGFLFQGYICAGETCTHLQSNGDSKHSPKPLYEMNEAELVYLNLCRFNGMTFKPDTCSCVLNVVFDKKQNETVFKHHPKITQKCRHHLDDTDEVEPKAVKENRLMNKTRALLLEDPEMSVEAVSLEFDEDRTLHIKGVGEIKKEALRQNLKDVIVD